MPLTCWQAAGPAALLCLRQAEGCLVPQPVHQSRLSASSTTRHRTVCRWCNACCELHVSRVM